MACSQATLLVVYYYYYYKYAPCPASLPVSTHTRRYNNVATDQCAHSQGDQKFSLPPYTHSCNFPLLFLYHPCPSPLTPATPAVSPSFTPSLPTYSTQSIVPSPYSSHSLPSHHSHRCNSPFYLSLHSLSSFSQL